MFKWIENLEATIQSVCTESPSSVISFTCFNASSWNSWHWCQFQGELRALSQMKLKLSILYSSLLSDWVIGKHDRETKHDFTLPPTGTGYTESHFLVFDFYVALFLSIGVASLILHLSALSMALRWPNCLWIGKMSIFTDTLGGRSKLLIWIRQ